MRNPSHAASGSRKYFLFHKSVVYTDSGNRTHEMSCIDNLKNGAYIYITDWVEKFVAFDLPLPPALRGVGWKVKIRDKEIREPPHVTIIRRKWSWRIDLRTKKFMDRQPDPDEVPPALQEIIREHWMLLCQQWDKMYPNNPVANDEV